MDNFKKVIVGPFNVELHIKREDGKNPLIVIITPHTGDRVYIHVSNMEGKQLLIEKESGNGVTLKLETPQVDGQ